MDLVAEGLVIQTWGNASGIDRARGLVVIKPSGVPYDGMKPEHMVVVSLETGKVVEGKLKPSSDTPTHLVLYRAFPDIGGMVHTHSLYATAWAQARRTIPAYGTTQADYWYGEVPCTRELTPAEIKNDYEANTGHVIVETFKRNWIRCSIRPCWWPATGRSPGARTSHDAVHNAGVLEFIARLASETLAHQSEDQADAAGAAGQTFSPQTRAEGLLRTKIIEQTIIMKKILQLIAYRLGWAGRALPDRLRVSLKVNSTSQATITKLPSARRRTARRWKSTPCATPKAPRRAS